MRVLTALCILTRVVLAQPVVQSVSKTIELAGSLARISTSLVLSGSGGPLEVGLDAQADKQLSWLEATAKGQPLSVTMGTAHSYIMHVPEDLLSTGNASLSISEVYIHASEPRPKQLQQAGEPQLMLWRGDLLGGLGKGRSIPEVKVRIKAPTANVKSYASVEGFQATRPSGSATVTYTGVFNEGDSLPAHVHYEQPDPVVAFRKLSRHVEISHWASNLAIKDDIQLVNDGPELKGFFSRLTHQQQGMLRSASGYNHVLSGLILQLPPGARDPYFVDTVGNVSTSNFRPVAPPRFPSEAKRIRAPTLELRPRYPLFGGWKYDFTVGYDLPLASYLRRQRADEYWLAVPFLTTSKNVAVDDVTLRIVLPEGATDVQVYPPFAADPRLVTHTTFLDTTGRPAIVMHRKTCTEKHMVDIIVSYRYGPHALFQKPLAVAGLAFGAFLVGIGLRRVTWQIGDASRKLQ